LSETTQLVEAGDVDGLLRRIDTLVDGADWAELARLCGVCRAAVDRGKQLWPVAMHGEYRLALTAPAQWAAPTVVESHAGFGFGPLTEVVAMQHTWNELRDHLPIGPERSLTAHERVLRGDTVDPAEIDPGILDLPTRLLEWEPDYPLAEYEPYRANFPSPAQPGFSERLDGRAGSPLQDEGVEALLILVSQWLVGSNGRADATLVEGRAGDAVATLGLRDVPAALVPPGAALAAMAWAAASGGAHGRRRGMATGRFDAWWALAALTGVDDPWPPPSGILGRAASELQWFLWHPQLPQSGWSLHLAVEDPAEGMAWALSAVDAG